MISAWVLAKMAYNVISIVAGLTFFYVTSQSAKPVKKQQLEESISLIINFILFIWVGKILLNIGIFVTDPLAVLAYPSDSYAFYAAVLLLLVNVVFKVRRKHLNISPLLSALVPIFLGSAFVYEFIDVVVNGNALSWGHLGLLLIVAVMFLAINERKPAVIVAGNVFAIWSAGQFLLTCLLPYSTLYGYIVARWFLIVVFIISVTVLIYNNRKRVRS
ncbi:hypothetical protein [Lentibacillus salinarum]|uniref:Uncharacterized protein n=1 Tax=Lentibacillus salinarum TaxID=446820 RepID=A0ABW3ZSF8_9BACI